MEHWPTLFSPFRTWGNPSPSGHDVSSQPTKHERHGYENSTRKVAAYFHERVGPSEYIEEEGRVELLQEIVGRTEG